MSTTLLRGEHLVRRLAGEITVTLINDVSLEIKTNEFVVITGPSGSGKSSLLYLLGLLDKPTSGNIYLSDVEITALSDSDLTQTRLEKFGFVFQSHFLLPEFTALENVMLPMKRLGALDLPQIEQRASELLSSLGLADQLHKIPRKLSGGQSQRVAIARALANDPMIILADEPTGNLDSVASVRVQEILRDLSRKPGKAVIAVTHDSEFAKTADRLIRLVDGQIV